MIFYNAALSFPIIEIPWTPQPKTRAEPKPNPKVPFMNENE